MTHPGLGPPGRPPSPGGGPLVSARPDPAARAAWLAALADHFETPAFLDDDPLGLVAAFDEPDDREVFGLFAAVLAWGRRATIRASLLRLAERMDARPARFVRDATPARAEAALAGFVHRTFSSADAVGLTLAVAEARAAHGSLGALMAHALHATPGPNLAPGLDALARTLLASPHAPRAKHLGHPATGSAAKRLAMYARWMTRPGPVDLGVWTGVDRRRLVVPLDVHTGRQARRLGLLARATDDWRAAEALAAEARALFPDDPARLDFALFGLGAYGVPDALPLPDGLGTTPSDSPSDSPTAR